MCPPARFQAVQSCDGRGALMPWSACQSMAPMSSSLLTHADHSPNIHRKNALPTPDQHNNFKEGSEVLNRSGLFLLYLKQRGCQFRLLYQTDIFLSYRTEIFTYRTDPKQPQQTGEHDRHQHNVSEQNIDEHDAMMHLLNPVPADVMLGIT